ncbi:MAG: methyltransferase domain-containing protein [Anaerolineae bacterium]
MVALNLGCGKRHIPDTYGVDIVALPNVAVIANFDGVGLPFAPNSVDKIHLYHVLEHMHDLNAVMEELHRICRNSAKILIEVPYYTCVGAFGDPTHTRFFTYETFRFWSHDTDQANWFTKAHFEIAERTLVFGKAHRLMGIAWLANRFPHIYENFFAFWFPARMLTVELMVMH